MMEMDNTLGVVQKNNVRCRNCFSRLRLQRKLYKKMAVQYGFLVVDCMEVGVLQY